MKRGIYYHLRNTEIQDLDKYNVANTLQAVKRINNNNTTIEKFQDLSKPILYQR